MPEVVEVRVQRSVQQPELVVGELDRLSDGRNLTRGPGAREALGSGQRIEMCSEDDKARSLGLSQIASKLVDAGVGK